MASWVCAGCTCRYAVGAPACPSCASVDCYEEGDDSMAKITRHGGPSTAFVRPGEGEFFQGAPDPEPITPEPEAGANPEGGAPSPGNSSSPSADETTTRSEPSETPRPSPVRTTGNRSSRGRGGN